ncbi:MAG: hypothetical protein ABJ275_05975 [Maricaulaceae bacterium]
MNVPTSSIAKVDIEGFVGGWVTDIELAVESPPKLYGFDFSRITEVWDDANGIIKTMAELYAPKRNDVYEFSKGERTMMKDLISSTLHQHGEVCISYHMFNPFLQQEHGVVDESNLGDYFTFNNKDSNIPESLAQVDMTTHSVSSSYLRVRFNHLGKMLDEILGDTRIDPNCNIHIRPFHEPNIGFFWWGQPKNGGATQAPSSNYLTNFYKLWKFAINEITCELTGNSILVGQKRARLKFVFSLNAETDYKALDTVINQYLPQSLPSQATTEQEKFAASIDILGLDYYQDDGPDYSGELGLQYDLIFNRANDLGMEHALTEVGMRTAGTGKMYGQHGGINPWYGEPKNFFHDTVGGLVAQRKPKWVMFWANRLGNSSLTRITPRNAPNRGPAGFESGLFYGDATANSQGMNVECMNVLSDNGAGQIYTPLSPETAFSLNNTYEAGVQTNPMDPNKDTIQIPGGDQALQYIPGAVERDSNCAVIQPLNRTEYGDAMSYAVTDFDLMVNRTMNGNPIFETL